MKKKPPIERIEAALADSEAMRAASNKYLHPITATTAQGAGAALEWISRKEAEGRSQIDDHESRLRKAIAAREQLADESAGEMAQKAVNRAKSDLDDAMERHHRLLKQLRDFDKSVAPEKRSAEETITREEGVEFVTMFTIYMRTAAERLKECIPQIRESPTNEDGFSMLDNRLSEEFENAIKMAVAQIHLPKWAEVAMLSAL